MKIRLLLCLLYSLPISCQNNSTKEILKYHLSLNKQLEISNQLIKKHNSDIIKRAHRKIQKMPSQRNIYSKLQALTRISTLFYNEVEVLKKQFINNPQKKQSTKVLEILFEKAHRFQKQAIQLVASSWDNGGIKGSIFADITQKQGSLQQLKKDMGTPIFEQLNAKTSFNKEKRSLPIFLTQLHSLQNDILCQENILMRFFSGQILSYCGYDRFDVYAASQKSSIRLGETYEASIVLGNYAPVTILAASVDEDSLLIINNTTTYQISPKQLGEQTYKATLTFQHLLTQEIEHRTQLFYFEVQ